MALCLTLLTITDCYASCVGQYTYFSAIYPLYARSFGQNTLKMCLDTVSCITLYASYECQVKVLKIDKSTRHTCHSCFTLLTHVLLFTQGINNNNTIQFSSVTF